MCHDSTSEFPLLRQVFGILPTRIVDTQLAKSFLGEDSSASFATLVMDLCGVKLDKGPQKSAWLNRPLTSEQLRYALDDAAYLLPLWKKLRNLLSQTEKMDWYREESEIARNQNDSTDEYAYVFAKSGPYVKEISQYSLLRDLLKWREEQASSLDSPRNWLVKDLELAQLANGGDCSERSFLKRIKQTGLSRWHDELQSVFACWSRRTDDLAYVLSLGHTTQKQLHSELRKAKTDCAKKVDISPELVFRKKQLPSIVDAFRANGQLPTWFGKWRVSLVGDLFRKILSSYIQPLKS